MRIGYGWGTLLTNDFRGLGPDGRLDPFSHRLQGDLGRRPAGREALRQSRMKAMGPPAEVARYRRVFQVGEQMSLPVAV